MTTGDKLQENTAKIRWGAHFKATREAMHLSEKDAASRLHLNPNMITLIESETFKSDTPVIFMRGYVRSYGRLLGISDKHLNQALLDLGLTDQSTVKATPLRTRKVIEHTNSNPITKLSTSVVVIVLVGLVGMWWNTHTRTTTDTTASSTLAMQTTTPETNSVANTLPTDPTPKELVQATDTTTTSSTSAGSPVTAAVGNTTDSAKSAVNNPTPAAAAVAENNNGMTNNSMAPATDTNGSPITANTAPNFDLPKDSTHEATATQQGTISSAQIGGLLDPNQTDSSADSAPVKKHLAKNHHKSQPAELAGDDMALPEPGLVPEPGDMDPTEN